MLVEAMTQIRQQHDDSTGPQFARANDNIHICGCVCFVLQYIGNLEPKPFKTYTMLLIVLRRVQLHQVLYCTPISGMTICKIVILKCAVNPFVNFL